jgi:hypothetical protein
VKELVIKNIKKYYLGNIPIISNIFIGYKTVNWRNVFKDTKNKYNTVRVIFYWKVLIRGKIS